MSFNIRGTKILLIEDSKTYYFAIKKMLHDMGCNHVDIVKNGHTALQTLRNKSDADDVYDVIFCDYNLGEGKDGREVLEEASLNNFIDSRTSIIMLTAETLKSRVLMVLKIRPDGYITKPVNSLMLSGQLNKILSKKQNFIEIYTQIANKQISKALNLCNQKVSRHPELVFDLMKIKSHIYKLQDNFDQLEKIYLQTLDIKPLTWAQLGLGKLYFYTNRLKQAYDVFYELKSSSEMEGFEALYWLAKTTFALQDRTYTQKLLVQVVTIMPDYLQGQVMLGHVAMMNFDLKTAQNSYLRAIKTGKNSCLKHYDYYFDLLDIYIDRAMLKEAAVLSGDINKEFSKSSNVGNFTFRRDICDLQIDFLKDKQQSGNEKLRALLVFYEQHSHDISFNNRLRLLKVLYLLHSSEQARKIKRELEIQYKGNMQLIVFFNYLVKQGIMQSGELSHVIDEQEIVSGYNDGLNYLDKGETVHALKHFSNLSQVFPGNILVNTTLISTILKAASESIIISKDLRVNADNIQNKLSYLEPDNELVMTTVKLLKRL